MKIQHKDATVYIQSSEHMGQVVEAGSVKLMVAGGVFLGKGVDWEKENLRLYKKVYIDRTDLLTDDGYLVVNQTDAYVDGCVVPKNCRLPLYILDNCPLRLIDVKVWERCKANFRQVPFSMVWIFGKEGPKRPPATNLEYFKGIWSYPQTTRGELNSWPDAYCRLLINAFTVPGDLIVDPFCGIGRLLGLAAQMGRKAIGYEINADLVPEIKRNLDRPAELPIRR